jgi:DNA-binding MarR family transcriptional regulator
MNTTSVLSDADFARLLAFRDGLRRFLHWSEDQARSSGLTGTQHQLLLAVRGHGSPPSIRDVADHLLLRHHSAVELVDRTVRAGLLRRVEDPDDQRVVRLHLTPDGECTMEVLAAAHLEELSRLQTRFGALWADLPTTAQVESSERGGGRGGH